jgi:hypothetical protein
VIVQLLTSVVAVCGFMMVQDLLGSGLTISQSRGLRFYPGFFDGLGDFPNKYGAAIVAVTAVHFSLWGWQTLLVVSACAATSFVTSNGATERWAVVLPRDNAEWVGPVTVAHRLLGRQEKI